MGGTKVSARKAAGAGRLSSRPWHFRSKIRALVAADECTGRGVGLAILAANAINHV
jgi:hypothetical protein